LWVNIRASEWGQAAGINGNRPIGGSVTAGFDSGTQFWDYGFERVSIGDEIFKERLAVPTSRADGVLWKK